jgi:hypothetical protein
MNSCCILDYFLCQVTPRIHTLLLTWQLQPQQLDSGRHFFLQDPGLKI